MTEHLSIEEANQMGGRLLDAARELSPVLHDGNRLAPETKF